MNNSITIEESKRIKELPPYLFVKIDNMKNEALKKGMDLIDLGIGDPDQETPSFIIKAFEEAIKNGKHHHYPSNYGLIDLRIAISQWYKERFQVNLNPENEILPLIGSKEGIGHIPLAFVNPGDIVLVPNPAYPVYQAATTLAGGQSYDIPLLEENGFLPNLDNIDPFILKKSKMLFLNYPNNPTGAVANKEYFEKVVKFAKRNNIIVCHDAAYTEIYFDQQKPLSFLEIEEAKEVGIEFHSFSKTYCMTGWRIGFAVGNSKIIKGLAKVKSNLDSGVFQAIQMSAIAALKKSHDFVNNLCKIYQERRDIIVDGLNKLNWETKKPKATFYIWIKVPPGYTSSELCKTLIEKIGIITTPGIGFGRHGEGYIRAALTVDKNRLQEAIIRLGNMQ
ncbi:MAG: LL-diaminopimelate aminotransferase [bacterium]|nr:LL-diaminopimelate aminotransferase [bacterium]